MIVCGPIWHEASEPPSSATLADDWRPYFEATVELFGAERCMVESNFPVDKAMWSYGILWNTLKRLAAGASETERKSLFSGTARRFYRIDANELS